MNRWEERAIPVLRALRSSPDRYVREGILLLGYGRGAALGVGLSDDAIYDTVLQLRDIGYVEYDKVEHSHPGGATFTGFAVTGRGLQVLGEWPRFEALVSPVTLAALIERLAEFAPPEEVPTMKRAASAVRRIGSAGLRSAAIGIGAQVLRHALGFP